MELDIVKNDPWLSPFSAVIERRHEFIANKERDLTGGKISLSEFADGYLYFGLHRVKGGGWVLREWAPNATEIFLIGQFSEWREAERFRLTRKDNGVWEINLNKDELHHEDLYKLSMHWNSGSAERVPAWATRVVQDEKTYIFSAQVWDPEKPYKFAKKSFTPKSDPLLIYECHIGMAQEGEKIGSYDEFRENILPRVIEGGYNAIQIMAIQEHPYYGSFGYHVSSFFAASSRFGTPEQLKKLVDEAHKNGIAVIMDIVHSHAVKNEVEGLGRYDGSYNQFFCEGERREHPAWDSLCFDYGKNEVLHFLLSNCKYWLEEYRFDGFRFDGVTSMLYYDHGLGRPFCCYDDYFDGGQDESAIAYLALANRVIHEVNPKSITIAEEMSGMPGLANSINAGGLGFDYRMAMGIPDFWIKTIKEKKDEDWAPTSIYWELTNRRSDEKTVNYAESHDQALVGDKTIIFRLMDDQMYWHMSKGDNNMIIERGEALHKMVRLVTLATNGGAYLNFMGNEFGHPEWIDFPRQGNGWSYKYARRQWSLVDREDLKYSYLNAFDKAMIGTVKNMSHFSSSPITKIWDNDGDQILAFMRKELLFVFNFNPLKSFTDYGMLVPKGSYTMELDSDSPCFGGFGRVDDTIAHFTNFDPLYKNDNKEWIKLYLPARTAMVLKLIKIKR